jgi:hypothetical protein
MRVSGGGECDAQKVVGGGDVGQDRPGLVEERAACRVMLREVDEDELAGAGLGGDAGGLR